MNSDIENKLIEIAEDRQIKNDPSHDFEHVRRVYLMAKKIAQSVDADLNIVIPAALFHDLIVYQKNSVQSKGEADESAAVTGEILAGISEYPQKKISHVQEIIRQCSFSKNIILASIEGKVVQDADLLEATGAISVMRTFASCGQMGNPLYPKDDPLCKNSSIEFRSGLDLFYQRLLIAKDRMHTEYAKKIADRRTEFLRSFLEEFKQEMIEAEII